MPHDPPDDAPSTSPPSRHRRFQEIMDAAAGGSQADYDGYGRFWELSLPQLRRLVLYGVTMFLGDEPAGDEPTTQAQSDESSCCHTGPLPASPSGRGAESGMVHGLRGQFPFDGTQFPPLPWGGTQVADDDIAFIEQWIDDGCPDADADALGLESAAHSLSRRARASGHEAHPELAGPVNQFLHDGGARKIRKNIRNLTADELARFRAAIAWMQSLDEYPRDRRSFVYWGHIHGDQCQHGWEEFLTWHRGYLYNFELQLQEYDKTVTLPYWNWPDDAENVQASLNSMGSATVKDNGYIPEAYQCWIDQPHIDALAKTGKVPAADLDGLRAIVYDPAAGKPSYSSGLRLLAAAKIAYGANPESDALIYAALQEINPLWHARRWPGGSNDVIFQAYPTPDDVTRTLDIESFFKFGSGPMEDQFYGALENIHNLIHNFSGGDNPNYDSTKPTRDEPPNGDMTNNGTAALDPIFWAHHANVDRVYWLWQQAHPNVGPDDPAAVLPPWNLTVADTSSTHRLGYDYAADTRIFPVDSSAPIERFRSEAVTIAPNVLAGHRRAEIRVHSVQHVTRAGFYVRAFLNTPDASVATPTRGNDRYVGQANMFTGLCIGGPGHCDVPEGPVSRYDKRKRHPKTPSNFRFDATDAVRKLAAAGETDFHVNLVVLNNDGTPAADAMMIDAVSLQFVD